MVFGSSPGLLTHVHDVGALFIVVKRDLYRVKALNTSAYYGGP